MKILCSCSPLSGHVFPMLPLASALRGAGHDVVFATGDAVAPAVASIGVELRQCGPSFDEMVADAFTRSPDTPLVTPDDSQIFGWGRLFGEVRIRSSVDDVRAVADELEPDLVVHETADLIGPLVAAERGRPSVNVGVGLVVREDHLRLAAEACAPWWERAGLAPRDDAGLYRTLYLNQIPRSIQRPSLAGLPAVTDLRPISHGDGEELPQDLEHIGTERPLVYVTFGTVFGDVGLVQRVLDAVSDLDVDVLVTVGESLDPAAVTTGPRVVVRSFVPQGAILERCAVVVSHGGVGSSMGPLSRGVPLVLIPLGADQFENAEALSAAGVAITVEASEAGSRVLADAVRRALGDHAVGAAAERIRREIQAMPSPETVVRRIESLVAT